VCLRTVQAMVRPAPPVGAIPCCGHHLFADRYALRSSAEVGARASANFTRTTPKRLLGGLVLVALTIVCQSQCRQWQRACVGLGSTASPPLPPPLPESPRVFFLAGGCSHRSHTPPFNLAMRTSGRAAATVAVAAAGGSAAATVPPITPAAAAAKAAWAVRRDQMVLPAARIMTSEGTQGSGFVIANDENGTFVLTNHHVIKDSIQTDDRWDPVEKSSKKVERTLPVNVDIFRYDSRGRHMQTTVTSAQVVAYQQYGNKWDFEGDLALLQLRAPVDGVPPAKIVNEDAYMDEVRVFDEVIMVGCPEGSPMPLPTTGHIASLTEERAGVGLLLSHVFGNPGSSGSAVYRYFPERNTYEVVAVHSMADNRGSLTDVGRGSFLRLAVPAPTLHGFLKSHGFSYLVDGRPGGSEGSDRDVDGGGNEDPSDDGDDSGDDAGTEDPGSVRESSRVTSAVVD